MTNEELRAWALAQAEEHSYQREMLNLMRIRGESVSLWDSGYEVGCLQVLNNLVGCMWDSAFHREFRRAIGQGELRAKYEC